MSKSSVSINDVVTSISVKDLKAMIGDGLNRESVRNLVNTYYDIQGYRIKIENRIRAASQEVEKAEEITMNLTTFADNVLVTNLRDLEAFIKKALEAYVKSDPIGQWCLSITGIGPVIAAGLISYIDINRCKTAGCIWAYAGITGKEVKKKGEKLNFSPAFKCLCWKIGQSFLKTSNRESDIYGHLYKEKKEFYQQKNEAGGFADRAKMELESKKVSKDSELYKKLSEGKLSDAHLNAMAERFAVKMFLSHLFEVWYEYYNGEKPPKPFVEAQLGHVHIVPAPNREILFG